jgi:hypothetical protein
MHYDFDLVFPRIALGTLGAITLCAGAFRLYFELRAHFWQKVEGVILSSEKQIQVYQGLYGEKLTRVIPKIVLQYTWMGKTHCRTASIYCTGYEQSTESIIKRFPSGKSVMIMVNPKKPDLAELEYKLTPVSWSLMLIGIILIFADYVL